MSEQQPNDPKNKNQWVEEIEVAGNDLVSRVKELIEEGNVRRLIIRKADGDVLMEVPLTASVVVGGAAVVFAPMLAALGALAALVTQLRIEVVRVAEPSDDTKQKVDVE
ncbi:MAG: DUF4342 domain-containing protein [Anaerolineae bacterium]|nr:DUF4342 domain-containing protein [Anaerolineae bacterium]